MSEQNIGEKKTKNKNGLAQAICKANTYKA